MPAVDLEAIRREVEDFAARCDVQGMFIRGPVALTGLHLPPQVLRLAHLAQELLAQVDAWHLFEARSYAERDSLRAEVERVHANIMDVSSALSSVRSHLGIEPFEYDEPKDVAAKIIEAIREHETAGAELQAEVERLRRICTATNPCPNCGTLNLVKRHTGPDLAAKVRP